MSENASDAELLRGWRDGDESCGRQLVSRHYGSLQRFFYGKVHDPVDDLVQAALLQCLKSADRFTPERGSFRSFLLGIAHNLLLHHWRADGREQRAKLVLGHDDPLESSPSGKVRGDEEKRVLLKALRKLQTPFQVVLELYYWEGLPLQEIGDIVGVPVGTVKSRLARAREALRSAIQEIEASPEAQRSTLDQLDAWAKRVRDAALD